MAEQSLLLEGLFTLREMGFFDFFLPFLLFFAIIYGALDKTKVFGEGKRDINSIIAFVIALIAATTAWVIEGIMGFLPWIGFIALVLVAFLMLVSMLYGDVSEFYKSKWLKGGAIAAVVIALIGAIYYGLGFSELPMLLSETDIALLIIGVVFIVVFFIIVKGGGGGKE